jgi:hypothetical protein
MHQQQDQYLFCQGFSHQSSESRTILPGGFHAIGFHCGSPVRKERVPKTAKHSQVVIDALYSKYDIQNAKK